MSRSDIDDAEARNLTQVSKARMGVGSQTLTGTTTLTHGMPPALFLDPGGATRIILMPTEADSKGLMFLIVNKADAAEDLTVKDDANAVTIGTISQNEMAILVCDGTTWSIGVGTTT
jgi:hypothetical protein